MRLTGLTTGNAVGERLTTGNAVGERIRDVSKESNIYPVDIGPS